ncbi:MAG: hypothetical protein PVG78_13490 [Desulfobacterales bacterium]|jgi:hypothetical protein
METAVPSRRETLVGIAILFLLVGIGLGILYERRLPNPAVVVYEAEGKRPVTPLAAGDSIPLPDGFSAMSPAEVFGPETLSDKIDGKAELYLAAGFQQLSARRLAAAESADAWMEVFVYRMADPRSAFAVYSAQQREGAQAVSRFRHGYRTDNALFFVHGPFYVEIVSASAEEDAGRLLKVADAFAAAHPVAEAEVSEKDHFPTDGLVPDSIVLQSADVFGFEQLDNVFIARYRVNDAEMAAFVSPRASDREAENLAKSYADFLIRFGGKPEPIDFPAPGGYLVEVFGVYELVFSSGNVLAGVHEAEDAGAALLLGGRLLDHLKGGVP